MNLVALVSLEEDISKLSKDLNIRPDQMGRATMAANKCSFTIYSKQIPKELTNGEFKLYLYGQYQSIMNRNI
jgi:hypothetical protein